MLVAAALVSEATHQRHGAAGSKSPTASARALSTGLMSPAMMAASYPRLGEWQRVRDRMDPRGIFISDLSRRLSL